jgi:[ribosomal protein S18]-alanine N-acetyltransferase
VPPTARIRPYRSEDFEALWQVDQRCFLPGIAYPREELRYFVDLPKTQTSVVEVAGVIAGFVVASVNPDRKTQRRTGHIITIDVLPEFRRRDLGGMLLFEAEAFLRASGCQGVLLETAVDNESALRFYKKHGYSVLQTLPGYYLGRIDALLLGKAFPQRDLAAPVDPQKSVLTPRKRVYNRRK